MIQITYAPSFLRQVGKLEADLQREVYEKVELFIRPENHQLLKVHKLHGRLKDLYSFSINYKFRVVFKYLAKNEVALLSIGDHDIYR